MLILVFCASICFLFVLIFFHFYSWCGWKQRKLLYQIPGYSERESWVLSWQGVNLPVQGVGEFLMKIFGDNTHLRSVWFLGIPNVNLNSPESIEAVLKSVQHITKGTEYFIFEHWLGEGLLTSTGAKWHSSRKMLTPAFHFRILENCMPIFNNNAKLLVTILKDHCKNGELFKLENFIPLCSLDIICEAAMGVKLDAQLHKHSEYVNAVRRMGELCLYRAKSMYLVKDWIYYMTSNGREQKKLLDIVHGFTEDVIRKSKQKRQMRKGNIYYGQEPSAFVDFLLEMAENEPGVYTDLNIRQEVDTFMFEGHETTASSISWSLLLLGLDAEIQEKVYNEQVAIFGESGRQTNKQDLSKMVYLEAVIKESLRLYPPVSYMSRRLDSELQLGTYTIPEGTNLIIIPYLLHRQSHLYAEPEKFDPDRFLNPDKQSRHAFMYIPFSGGPRNCIGQRFAMMELKVVLSHILRNFRVQSITRREGLKVLFSPILRPMDGTFVKLFPRA